MFILVYVVLFGPKKGNLASYSAYWGFLFSRNNQVVVNADNRKQTIKVFGNNLMHGFQFTPVTSRLTTIVLFSF